MFAAAVLCQPGTAPAQTRIESYHGAWTVRCNIGTHAPALCAAVTRKLKVIGTKTGKRRVGIKVVRAKGALFFQVDGPYFRDKLGPVRLELDGEFVKTIPFNCGIRGILTCIAETPFSKSLRSRFRKAKTLTIEFVQDNGRPFTMTVPLNGLEEAVAALAKR